MLIGLPLLLFLPAHSDGVSASLLGCSFTTTSGAAASTTLRWRVGATNTAASAVVVAVGGYVSGGATCGVSAFDSTLVGMNTTLFVNNACGAYASAFYPRVTSGSATL